MQHHTPGPWRHNTDFNEIQTTSGNTIAKVMQLEDGDMLAIAPEAVQALLNLYFYSNDLIDYYTGMKDDTELDITHVMEGVERSLTEAATVLTQVQYLDPDV